MANDNSVSSSVTAAVQEFHRLLTLAIADKLPAGKSDYRKLKIKQEGKEMGLWEWLQEHIAAEVLRWPEWHALMSQQGAPAVQAHPQGKSFDRYSGIAKKVKAPTSFADFNESFRATAEMLRQQTVENIGKAVAYSLKRLENNPDYQEMVEKLQRVVDIDKVAHMAEALPLLDICQPTRLAHDITETLMSRLQDEIKAIDELAYPYNQAKTQLANFAIVMRVQVQIKTTYQDKFSRLVAAAESKFGSILGNEVLQGELLPWVRNTLLDTKFLRRIAR